MKKKIAWLVVSGLMVVSLVLASCAPAVTEKKEEVAKEEVAKEEVAKEEVAKEEVKKEEVVKKEVVAPAVEEPTYGGVLTWSDTGDPQGFDNHLMGIGPWTWTVFQTNDPLLAKDWTKAAGGTNEWSCYYNLPPPISVLVGMVVESWEIIQPDTFIYHIRHGIHWGLNPDSEASRLVGGREMTADDVVYSFRRAYTEPTNYTRRAYPLLADMKNVENSVYIDPDDPWTVVVKTIPGKLGHIFDMWHLSTVIVPHEVVEKYGDMSDWRNSVGTGPFFLVDYVSGSSLTFKRNPNYWMKDPYRPENRLPYLDGIKVLIMTDVSTIQAAFRTAKIDILGTDTANRLSVEDAESIMRTNPEVKGVKYLSESAMALYMRNDVAPFDDVNVRRAMMMAINNPEIAEKYFYGGAKVLSFPGPPIAELKDMLVTLDELPEESRWLYEYHPDKAEQLLDEAGYPGPNRFTTSIVASTSAQIDMLSIIKSYWEAIGVTLEIRPKEYGVYNKMGRRRSYEQGYMGTWAARDTTKLWQIKATAPQNKAFNSEPLPQEIFDASMDLYFDEAARARVIREAAPELISRAYVFALPVPYYYYLWQPWLKGYHGETQVLTGVENTFTRWVWIDQDLKEELTGSR